MEQLSRDILGKITSALINNQTTKGKILAIANYSTHQEVCFQKQENEMGVWIPALALLDLTSQNILKEKTQTQLLTKSLFMSGLRCPKKMWLEINNSSMIESLPLAQKRIIQQGIEVQEYARKRFSSGYLIEGKSSEALEKTQKFLHSNIDCLFEAAFLFNDILVRCDILQKTKNASWDLIEIKSSGSIKDEYIDDIAIQKYVLINCSLPINKVKVMHINTRTCFFPNLENLFVIEDVSDKVDQRLSELNIESKINQFKEILNSFKNPLIAIGKHCINPQPCSFQSNCWQNIPEGSIFTIPRLSTEKLNQLVEREIFAIKDINNQIKLTPNQKKYVDLISNNQPNIDFDEIQNIISTLQYPLHFFDIETQNPAIPRFEGLKPYEQFIFQYSCHILHKDKSLEHYEYLHTDNSDPRPSVIESLINHIEPTGTIIVYHQSFESNILKKLAQDFPQYKQELLCMVERLWDLEEIFKQYYQHPKFYGSTSIKKVLPVLVRDLSYDKLEIQRGDVAQAIWDSMIICSNKNKKSEMIKNLKEYCQLDTLAMVKIHEKLLEIIN